MTKINRSLRVLVLIAFVTAAFLVSACGFTQGDGSTTDQGLRRPETQQARRQETLQVTLQAMAERRAETGQLYARLSDDGSGDGDFR